MEPENLDKIKKRLIDLANEYQIVDAEQRKRMREIEELRNIIREIELVEQGKGS